MAILTSPDQTEANQNKGEENGLKTALWVRLRMETSR